MKLRHLSVAAILAALVGSGLTASYAAGLYPVYPGVGVPSFCAGSIIAGVPGTAAVCSSTVPAGPATVTGNEYAAFDTGLSQGQQPQTVTIQTGLLAPGAFATGANALIGSDFGVNLWQRGTIAAAGNSITPSTATWVADGWYVFSSGNTVAVSKQTGAADIPSALTPTLASMRLGRPSGSNVTAICTGQILPVKDSERFIGNNAIFSAYLLAGGGLSSTNNAVTMSIAYYTAADSTTSGTNTNTFASSIGATQNITGYIEAVNGVQNISTTWTRYTVAAAIPATNATGTAVTGVGVKICYTPVGTGGATDFLEVANAQFEPRIGSSVGPSGYNRRLPAEEWQLAYSRVFESTEGAAETVVHGVAQAMTTTVAEAYVQFPVEMRLLTPTATFNSGFAVTTASGAVQVCSTTAQGKLPSSASLASMLSSNGATVSCTVGTAVLVAGNASLLIDNNTSGNMQFAAEP